MDIKITFVIGVSEPEIEMLRDGHSISTKMILTHEDHSLFHYKTGETIQVETENGYRLWCTIKDLEALHPVDKVILIFTLGKALKS
jgi:uncharacterized protein YqfB (UPF0267 family)